MSNEIDFFSGDRDSAFHSSSDDIEEFYETFSQSISAF